MTCRIYLDGNRPGTICVDVNSGYPLVLSLRERFSLNLSVGLWLESTSTINQLYEYGAGSTKLVVSTLYTDKKIKLYLSGNDCPLYFNK